MKTYYKKGEWNVICDVCGFKKKSSEVRKRWDGLYVCKEDWETRHPQEFLRTPKDDQSIPWSRPEGEDTFINPSCTTRVAVAGNAIAGCAITGYDDVDQTLPTGTFNNEL